MADFGKLNFAVAFNPQTAFPLDARYYFDTLEAATTAAQSAVEVGSSDGTYFIGENLVVVTSTDATLYVIQPDKTLKAVGTSVLGDGKSIVVSDGTVSIKGFADATVNQQPRKNASGEIEWYTPDTSTVAGLADTVGQHTQQIENLTSDISSLSTNKADKDSVYTKTETDNQIKSAISSVYKPAGSIAFIDLPALTSDNEGKVYNITDEFTTTNNFVEGAGKKYSAGQNVVIIKDSEGVYKYDVLSGIVDLSNYSTTAEVQAALDNKVDKVEGKGLSTNDFTTTLLDKLNGITAGAQVNTIDEVKINGTLLSVVDKSVNIPGASADNLGVVKGSSADNGVTINKDYSMTVNNISTDKLVSGSDTLVWNGGDATL